MTKKTFTVPPSKTKDKSHKFAKASEHLSQKARLALNMPRCAARQRQPGEALPVTIHNGMPSAMPYRTGDGEVRQAQRPGSTVALAIRSHGFPT